MTYSSPDIIQEMLVTMERNRKVINEDIATLVYYMNGALDYNDAWMLTNDQRKTMSKVVEKHYKILAQKNGQTL